MKAVFILSSLLLIASNQTFIAGTSTLKQNFVQQINSFTRETLSPNELKSLKRMREEEKLAHDVYITLYNKWGIPIFKNISHSEQTHTDAVLLLINKYKVIDPVGTNGIGIFADTGIQQLYNRFITEGSTSLLDAFITGATIEDLDIFDLNNWSSKVEHQDIKSVYQNLTNGSKNHLRSFYSKIKSLGGIYGAKYISQNELNAVINKN